MACFGVTLVRHTYAGFWTVVLNDSYRVTVLPTTIMIDPAGIVRVQRLGPLDRTQLRELLATHS